MKAPKYEHFIEGFFAGFDITAERFNAEYPYGDKDINPRTDERILKKLSEAYKQYVESLE